MVPTVQLHLLHQSQNTYNTHKKPQIKWKINMIVDNKEYVYGVYNDNRIANEIAMQVRDARNIDTYVERVEM